MINLDNYSSPEDILSAALDADLEHVLVIGRSAEGVLTIWTNAIGRDVRRLTDYATDHLT